MSEPQRSLSDVLLAAQKRGTLGQRPIDEVIEHSRHFVRALPNPTGAVLRVIDLGSGAGVPGLVIAVDRPDVSITLVDRRATRMDALTRAVASLGLASRAHVITADAAQLGRNPAYKGQFDVVVSRGLGPPGYTARLARPFLCDAGLLIVSEPPQSDLSRWVDAGISEAGFDPPEHCGSVAVLRATTRNP